VKQVIRPSEIKDYMGLSKSSAFRLEKEGRFPKRRQIGPAAVGWFRCDLDAYLASRPEIGADNVRTVAAGAKRGRPKKAA